MNKVFPTMCDRPKNIILYAFCAYWGFCFVLAPMYMPYIGAGLWETTEWIAWLEIVYHLINALVVSVLMIEYLKDSWFMLTLDWQKHLKLIGLTVGLIVAVLVQQIIFLFLGGYSILDCLDALPILENSVSQTGYILATTQPVFGTISMVVCSPIAVCGLFYALSFAPLCVKGKPVLAYLSVVVVTAIPAIIDILWRQQVALQIVMYLMRLPAHLIACWSYQKTDNVWTPIISLAIVNLLASLVAVFL